MQNPIHMASIPDLMEASETLAEAMSSHPVLQGVQDVTLTHTSSSQTIFSGRLDGALITGLHMRSHTGPQNALEQAIAIDRCHPSLFEGAERVPQVKHCFPRPAVLILEPRPDTSLQDILQTANPTTRDAHIKQVALWYTKFADRPWHGDTFSAFYWADPKIEQLRNIRSDKIAIQDLAYDLIECLNAKGVQVNTHAITKCRNHGQLAADRFYVEDGTIWGGGFEREAFGTPLRDFANFLLNLQLHAPRNAKGDYFGVSQEDMHSLISTQTIVPQDQARDILPFLIGVDLAARFVGSPDDDTLHSIITSYKEKAAQ
ncbi:MAG: hypothetical protein ACPGVK_00400 [Halocynthiibacter sp.]